MNKILFFILALISLSLSFGALADNNEAYWKLDSDLLDSTGNGWTLTNSGSVATSNGKINGAYNLTSSTNQLSQANQIIVGATTDDYSVSAWFRLDTPATTATIFQSVDTGGSEVINMQYLTTNDIRFQQRLSGGSSVFTDVAFTNDNLFHFVTMSFNNSNNTLNFYIDGVFKGTLSPSDVKAATRIVIGNDKNLGNELDGTIDEVSLWSRPLLTEEVFELYNSNTGLQYPYTISVDPIVSNVTTHYDSENISIELNTTANVNMSYILDTIGNTNFNHYYSFDDTLKDIKGSDDITLLSGSELYGIGKVNNSFDINNANGLDTTLSVDDFDSGSDEFTISFWFNRTSYGGSSDYLYSQDDGGSNRFYLNNAGSNSLAIGLYDWTETFNPTITNDALHFVSITFNGSEGNIYFDGGLIGTKSSIVISKPSGSIKIGAKASGTSSFFNGLIDEFKTYNRALSPNEVNNSYNEEVISICSDCNGSILDLNSLSEGLHNISFKSVNGGGVAWTNESFTIDLTPPLINNTLPLEINSYFLNISEFVTCSDVSLSFCNITFQPDNQEYEVNQTSLVNFTYNGNQTYVIEAQDIVGNIILENGTILVNPITNITFFDSNSTQIFNYTLGGLSFVDIANISYYDSILEVGTNNTLLFVKSGYTSGNITLELLNDSRINKNYTIPFAQINLVFIDVEDNSFITDQNITAEIIGESFSQQYFINQQSNYSIIEPELIDGEYTISFISQNYSVAFRNFIYSANANLSLAIYLTPIVTPGETIVDLIIEVVDDYKNIQPNIDVLAYIWNSDAGQYVVQNEKTTNDFGTTTFSVFQDTKLYQFCAEYNNELFCKSSVTIDSSTQVLPLRISILNTIEVNRTNIYLVDFPNSLNYTTTGNDSEIVFTWNNAQQNADSYCLKVEKKVLASITEVYNNCSSLHSGALTYLINNQLSNETYFAESYFAIDSDIRNLDRVVIGASNPLQDELQQYGLHIIAALLLVFGAVAIGYSKKIRSVSVTHWLLPLASLIVFIAFPIIHNFESVLLVLGINIVALIYISKTFEKQEKVKFDKLNLIILAYMVFIGGLVVMFAEMDSQGILDDRGQKIKDYLDPQDSTLNSFFEEIGTNFDTQQSNSKEGDFSIFNIIFTKALGFIDTFFLILEQVFLIPTTIGFLLDFTGDIFDLVLGVLTILLDIKIILIYFEKLFK